MSVIQVVDFRTAGPRRYFVDERDEAAFHARIAAARAAIPRHVQYAVAPDQQVRGRDGSWLRAGTHVSGTDDLYAEGDEAPWRRLRDLVFSGRLLENYSFTPPEGAE